MCLELVAGMQSVPVAMAVLEIFMALFHPPVRCRILVLCRKQIRLLERFHQRCLRSILGIKWQDHVSNEEVLKRASLPGIKSILPQMQLRWAEVPNFCHGYQVQQNVADKRSALVTATGNETVCS